MSQDEFAAQVQVRMRSIGDEVTDTLVEQDGSSRLGRQSS